MAKNIIEHRVNVYFEETVIARVRYNNNLDYWDGKNWLNGGVGKHKGLTKLATGDYVLIHGTDYQGEHDFAEIITERQALQEILRSQNTQLLNTKKFKALKALMADEIIDETLISEIE